jgi:hypothetical protein
MSAAPPEDQRALRNITGVSEGMAQRRGRDILARCSVGWPYPRTSSPASRARSAGTRTWSWRSAWSASSTPATGRARSWTWTAAS